MKCDKGHTPIEWDEKRLFCCPSCLSHAVHNRQREVIARLEKALIQSQTALHSVLKQFLPEFAAEDNAKTKAGLSGKTYEESEVINLYRTANHTQEQIKNGF